MESKSHKAGKDLRDHFVQHTHFTEEKTKTQGQASDKRQGPRSPKSLSNAFFSQMAETGSSEIWPRLSYRHSLVFPKHWSQQLNRRIGHNTGPMLTYPRERGPAASSRGSKDLGLPQLGTGWDIDSRQFTGLLILISWLLSHN